MTAGRYLDSELYLPSCHQARLSWAGREYLGEPALDRETAARLAALEATPDAYGRALYGAVLPAGSALREGLSEAVLAAERERRRLRFRLHLAPDLPDWVHALAWELMADPGRRLALARSPDTAFSRYSSVARPLGEAAVGRPRLLCLVAAPADAARFGMAELHRDRTLRRLKRSFAEHAAAIEIEVLEPPVTPGRLRERLMAGEFHLLHVFGHGLITAGSGSALVLEDERGRARFVEEELLAEIFLGERELRLVTLLACHGGAPSSTEPFSGLAGRLVQRGLPAVVAMRRAVSVETAHLFTDHFYRHLAASGHVDAAVNEARHQLYLADPRGIAWSSPVLYQRLAGGRLWVPADEAEETGEEPLPVRPRRFDVRRLRRPAPWMPAALWLLLAALGRVEAPRAEAQLDLLASRVAFRLAASGNVIERLHLEEIAATRLSQLRLPAALAAGGPRQAHGAGGMTGFRLATRSGGGARLTLNAVPLPAKTEVVLEHQGGQAYRVAFAGSPQELTVTYQGAVLFQRLGSAAVPLRLDHPETLVLAPQRGVVDVDLLVARFAGDEISPGIAVERLDLLRIAEQHSAHATTIKEFSTLLGGEVRLQATGRRHGLGPAETLRASGVAGTLTGVRLGQSGLRLRFRGRVGGLQRTAPGGAPRSLMPSVLDLCLPAPHQAVVEGTLGAVAAATLLFAARGARPRSRVRRPAPPGSRSRPPVRL